MLGFLTRLLAFFSIIVIGCSSPGKKDQKPAPVVGRGTPAVPKPLSIPDRPLSPARQPDEIEDRTLLIPPPPKLDSLTKQGPLAEPPIVQVKGTADHESIDPSQTVAPKTNTNSNNASALDRVDDDGLTAMKRLYETAVKAFARLDAFEARLTRRETINGKVNPQEVIRFLFRQQPYSVRLKWIGGEGQGRELIYVQRQANSKLHIMPTKQDSFPLQPRPMSFAPDDSMVRSKSRHDVREAGLNHAIKHIGNVIAAIAKNPSQRNRLKYMGLIQRPEFVNKLEVIEETVVPRTENMLSQGGKRVYFFDVTAGSVSNGLPVMVITYDIGGKEVEYCCFDRFLFPVRLDDADFDPDRVWGKK